MLSTVWSAPNYCYRAGNKASVLEISPYLEKYFNVFDACPSESRIYPPESKSSPTDPNVFESFPENITASDYLSSNRKELRRRRRSEDIAQQMSDKMRLILKVMKL
jgi:hypothetical protein